MHGLGQAQRALLGTITSGLSAVGDAQGELEKRADLPPLGTDPVSTSDRAAPRDLREDPDLAGISRIRGRRRRRYLRLPAD